MQNTSADYKRILADVNHQFETRLSLGDTGVLITRNGDRIVFGGDTILVDRGDPDTAFGEDFLINLETERKVFANGVPEVGCCIAGEITVEMVKPDGEIPRMGRIVPYVRAIVDNGDGDPDVSEWLSKGIYYIDTRELTANTEDGVILLTLHGYDAMLKTEQDYASSDGMDWPSKDAIVVRDIANKIGVKIDSRTWEKIPYEGKYLVQLPSQYTYRETLGFIGAMYAGNWIMNDVGELRLVTLNELPRETRILIDHAGFQIVFGEGTGEVKILV